MPASMTISQRFVVSILLAISLVGVGSWGAVALHHGLVQDQSAFSPRSSAGCLGQGTAATCLEAHLGILEQLAEVRPPRAFTAFVALFLVALAWWRWLLDHNALSRWRSHLRRQRMFIHHHRRALVHWLTLHEKRDPLPIFMVQRSAFLG